MSMAKEIVNAHSGKIKSKVNNSTVIEIII